MSDRLLDEMLKALAGSTRRMDQLEVLASGMIGQPSLAGTLVKRLISQEADETRFEDLSELLTASLETARIAAESGRSTGARFVMEAHAAIERAAEAGELDTGDGIIFSRIWLRAGLTPPEELRSAEPVPRNGPPPGVSEDPLSRLFEDCRHDPFQIHAALGELFPAMPEETVAGIILDALSRQGETWDNLGCLFLLDPDPRIRLVAAEGFADRVKAGQLSASCAHDCVLLRSWMPADAARGALDAVLKTALRGGMTPARAGEPAWKVKKILASVPDGSGAMTFCACLERAGHLSMAFVLIKAGFGVRDAYSVPFETLQEQQRLEDRFMTGTAALPVSKDWFAVQLASALAEGLENGDPPAPGLIGIASICGLTGLRPQPFGLEDRLAALPAAERISALGAQATTRLIRQSEHWPVRHPVLTSWFENQDEVLALADLSPAAASRQLWAFLETRRTWWAERIAECAGILSEAGHKDADSFTAVALALSEGAELKKIPVLQAIHYRSMEFMASAPDAGDPEDGAPFVEVSFDPLDQDELDKLLAPTGVTTPWLEGFLLAILLAPKPVEPGRWMTGLINDGIGQMPPGDPERFFQGVFSLYGMLEQAASASEGAGLVSALPAGAQREFASGFCEARDLFRASWPAKSLSVDDRNVLARFEAAENQGFGPADQTIIGAWISARHQRNTARGRR